MNSCKKRLFLFITLFVCILGLLYIVVLNFSKTDIAIISAMNCEIDNVIKNIKKPNIQRQGEFLTATGKIGKYRVVAMKSGVGKVNAAFSSQYLIDKFNPKLIINTGIAGATIKDLKVKDIVIADSLVQHDFDLTAFGYPKGYVSNDSKKKNPTLYFTNKDINKKIEKIIKEKYPKSKVINGNIASGDKFVYMENEKKQINKLFNTFAVDMESAAIAKVANINNVPCVVIRAISDELIEKKEKYAFSEHDVANFSADVLVDVLLNIELK